MDEAHISDTEMRRLFGRVSSSKEMAAAMRHILRCGACLELFVEVYTSPASDLEYDKVFAELKLPQRRRTILGEM